MPNCDFYGNIDDHERLLKQLFELRECQVYQLYAEPDQSLKQFNNVDSVLSEFDRSYLNGDKYTSIYLQLYVTGCGFEFEPTKVALDPAKSGDFTFRYTADQYSLIQLYLEIPDKENILRNSHTNHSSEKRAKIWTCSPKEIQQVKSCDFKEVTMFSSKLNRMIRKESVGKISSRAVLKGACDLWDDGFYLGPYHKDKHEISRT